VLYSYAFYKTFSYSYYVVIGGGRVGGGGSGGGGEIKTLLRQNLEELKLPLMKKVTEIFHGFFWLKIWKNILKNITKGKKIFQTYV
jgi:hypothetical protein